MLLTESSPRHLQTFGQILIFTATAMIVTFLLFVLMYKLIESDVIDVPLPAPVSIDGVLFQADEEKTITKQPIRPIEPMKQQPRVEPQPIEPSDEEIGIAIDSEPVKLIGLGTFDDFTPKAVDRDARPIVRVPPRYPPSAASQGIEGWVKLSFTINELGGVEDVLVLDSEPKRLFDRAAKRALSRWKYQPKLEQGQAIVRTGLSVVLEFNLQQ
jgi:protein TonB